MGCTGGIQLWTASYLLSPWTVFLATSKVVPYAMFWDISQIHIDTAKGSLVKRNVMSTWTGRIYLIVSTLVCWVMKWLLDTIQK
jgi:hypothetical protein